MAFTACSSSDTEQADADTVLSENETDSTTTSMVYIGTYAAADSSSIFLYHIDTETGELKKANGFQGGESPSYLALDPSGNYLYAVNEMQEFEGRQGGAVSAFSVNQKTGDISLLNRVSSRGGSPCHIAIDGNTVLVANYMGGNVASFPLQEKGKINEAASLVQHSGTGPNPERQEAPHAHFISPGPENRFVFSVDLGADRVFGYRLDENSLVPNSPAVAFASKAGSGPRHLAFHPSGSYAYLLHELNSTMVALAYNGEEGTFTEIQSLPTLPEGFSGNNQPAAVKVSADGKYVYGSNRGHNSIVVYSVDENTGKLTFVQHASTGGDWPRDFTIDPTGKVLLVANERSNNVTTFMIDNATGKLTATGHEAQVHKPVNLVFR
ncbi:lactonase family protein [Pontibacter rugosus]